MGGRISYLGGIVTQGLVLDLDAAKQDSYPRLGSAWRDISGRQNNSTLTNGPTFNSLNGGSLLFDGVNEYGETIRDISLRPDNVTMCAWVKYTGAQTLTFVGGYGNTGLSGYWLGASATQFMFQAGNGNLIGGGTPILNFGARNSNINYLCGTFDGTTILGYLNGVLGGTLNQTTPGPLTYPTSGTSPLLGGMFIGNIETSLASPRYWTGNIYQITIYNRALSAAEVLQNYNATKGRYL